ncbi:MAG: hypothetical protein Q7U41_02990 [Microbacterium sp.]|nr:hypothetical protein [Microbacterium sp.]
MIRILGRLLIVVAMVGVLAAGGYVAIALLQPVGAIAAETALPAVTVRDGNALDAPSFGGSAVTVLEDAEGAVLSDGSVVRDGDRGVLPMASITKVVTALVVLDAHPLRGRGPTLVFTAADVARYHATLAKNGAAVPVQVGQAVRLRDALEVMLVESAGNWAESISIWAFGSEQAFLDAADRWLEANGLYRTVIENPAGWAPNRSTSADLIALGVIANADPVVAALVAVRHDTVPGVGEIDSTNELVGEHGVDGIKTGTLDRYNLLFSADRRIAGERVTIIGVVLGAPSEDALNGAVTRLLDSVAGGFARVRVHPGTLAVWTAPWGSDARAMDESTQHVRVWGETGAQASVSASPAVPAGQTPTATLTVEVAGAELQHTVVAERPIAAPDVTWLLTNPLG